MSSPDPVSQPSEYQALLLRYLGDQDPAEVQGRTPRVAAGLVSEAGDLLRTRPQEREWSVLELIGHLHDAELVSGARYRWILAQDRPSLIGYDQDLWVERLGHNQGDPAALLATFGALRTANLELWSGISPEERDRVGMHVERGQESVDLMFRMLGGHDLFHIDQMNRTLAAVRER
jgi:DinB superfamily